MVTKKDIKDLDFKKSDQFYEYVVESIVNGNGQAKGLIKMMSQRQRNQFMVYLDTDCPFHHSYIDKAKQLVYGD